MNVSLKTIYGGNLSLTQLTATAKLIAPEMQLQIGCGDSRDAMNQDGWP